MDDRPGAEKYNEAMIKTYMLHPEAVAQFYYRKAMEFDPTEILKISKNQDIENQLMEFYDKNRIVCDLAFVLNDGHSNFRQLTDDAKEYLSALKYSYQTISSVNLYPQRVDYGYFTLPVLNDEQLGELYANEDMDNHEFVKKVARVKEDGNIIKVMNDDLKKVTSIIENNVFGFLFIHNYN